MPKRGAPACLNNARPRCRLEDTRRQSFNKHFIKYHHAYTTAVEKQGSTMLLFFCPWPPGGTQAVRASRHSRLSLPTKRDISRGTAMTRPPSIGVSRAPRQAMPQQIYSIVHCTRSPPERQAAAAWYHRGAQLALGQGEEPPLLSDAAPQGSCHT